MALNIQEEVKKIVEGSINTIHKENTEGVKDMAETKNKRLKLETLIAAKTKKEEQATKELEIPSLGGTVLAKKLSNEAIADVMDRIDAKAGMSEMLEVFKELIYKSVALFHNDELLKTYNCVEPYDIVSQLLELGEIMNLGNEILEMYGFDTLADDVKN